MEATWTTASTREKFPPPYWLLTRKWTTLRSCRCWAITVRISVLPTKTARPRLTWARLRGHRRLIDQLEKSGVLQGELPGKPAIQTRTVDLQAGNETWLIAEAVQKSIDLLQLSSDTFLDVREQLRFLPSSESAGRGDWLGTRPRFSVPKSVYGSGARTPGLRVGCPAWADRSELDSPYPVPPTFLGYGMWMFAELGYRPDELTRAVSGIRPPRNSRTATGSQACFVRRWEVTYFKPRLWRCGRSALSSARTWQELAERIGRARLA